MLLILSHRILRTTVPCEQGPLRAAPRQAAQGAISSSGEHSDASGCCRRPSCGLPSTTRPRCPSGSPAATESRRLAAPRRCPSTTGPCSHRTCSRSCRTPAAGPSSSRLAMACGCPWTLSSMAPSPRGSATLLPTATLSSSTALTGLPLSLCPLPPPHLVSHPCASLARRGAFCPPSTVYGRADAEDRSVRQFVEAYGCASQTDR